MAIAIDASTPALANSVDTAPTASFTAPAGSLLVALCAFGGGTGTNTIANSGTALTWAPRVNHQVGEDSGAFAGTVTIFTAVAPTAVARTVTATAASGGSQVSLKLLVITGADVANPVGAVGENHSTTANLTAAAYTSTVAASRAVGIATDSNADTTPTSADVGFGIATITDDYSGIAVYKAADTATAGSAVTLNFNGTGGSRTWNWAAIEILPAVVPFLAPRPLILGQAINRAAYI
ncbi:hypothetical protein [Nonomuraea sp. NPDC049141]|uniref:hypothetical protein n=1 Tax=Nonomuraea sp. NPDC049141 TaxID=3155500 RepID=UPI00340819A1